HGKFHGEDGVFALAAGVNNGSRAAGFATACFNGFCLGPGLIGNRIFNARGLETVDADIARLDFDEFLDLAMEQRVEAAIDTSLIHAAGWIADKFPFAFVVAREVRAGAANLYR